MENKTIGIYAIFRKCDNKCMYIGQSGNCEARINTHICGKTHTPIENPNDYYADIIEKHGFDSKEFRLSREAFWINIFEPEWNKVRNRKHSEETRQKLGEAHLGENNGMYGKHHSEETRQKLRESHLGKPSGTSGKHWKLVDGKRVYY